MAAVIEVAMKPGGRAFQASARISGAPLGHERGHAAGHDADQSDIGEAQEVEAASANLGALGPGTEAVGSGSVIPHGLWALKRRGAGQTQKFYVNPIFRLRRAQRTELRPPGPGGLGRGFYLLLGVR